MAARPRDWLKQAERDLIHARHSLAAETYEWACFACQQSGKGSEGSPSASGRGFLGPYGVSAT